MLLRYIFFFSLLLLTTLGISPSAGFSGFMPTAPNIGYGSAGKTIASTAAKAVAELGKSADKVAKGVNPGSYRPDRELPRDKHGNPVPDSPHPHTQLGTKKSRNGDYTQAREFDANGNPVRDIDFTDHGRPQNHPNPHQHRYVPNETGGSLRRLDAEPL